MIPEAERKVKRKWIGVVVQFDKEESQARD
jgi:hypothetical protein